nr:MAG: putative capsid protein [Picobirnavirus sp.]
MAKENNNKSRSRNKTVKRSQKYSRRIDDQEYSPKEREKAPARNDAPWYAQSEQLLRDAASIPFAWMTGRLAQLGTLAGKYKIDDDDAYYNRSVAAMIPGVCALEIAPTLGHAEDVTDPANVAATSIYSFVRYMNSGASNYEATDLMMYLMAMSQVYSAINWAQRLYGMVTKYSQENKYMPRTLLLANGVSYDSMMNNLANFRMGLNVIINKAASMAVPNVMDIFQRYAFLYRDVYIEGMSIKDQLYMYVPKGFHKFVPTSGTTPGSLKFTPWTGSKSSESSAASYLDVLNYINDMLEPLILDEDMNIMSGDIKKAYGDGNLITLTELGENYSIDPKYTVEVLEQMHNATVAVLADNTLDITQSTYSTGGDTRSYLVSNPSCRVGGHSWVGYYMSMSKILTTALPEPKPEDVMVNSRLIAAYDRVPSETDMREFASIPVICGSDVCTNVRLYKIRPLNPGVPTVYSVTNVSTESATVSGNKRTMTTNSGWGYILNVGMFHYAPILPAFSVPGAPTGGGGASVDDDSTGTLGVCGILGDIDNYAVIDINMLRKMHEVALLSLYNVPITQVARAK